MDLSDQKGIGLQSRFTAEYGNHVFKLQETFEETDIKGNNSFFNSLKTETNGNHDHSSSSLFQVKYINEKNLEVNNPLLSYSSFKKAMDLRTHNRTLDGRKRTIFDDAEYFAKNYRYKLLPITFEQVDETIIRSEHNYSLFSLNSESEPEENFSRTMDYSQIKEKNYKRRRTKFRERIVQEELVQCRDFESDKESGVQSSSILCHQKESCAIESISFSFGLDNTIASQPLDLSSVSLVQEEKSDHYPREHPSSIAEKKACDNDEVVQLDSDKENLNSESNDGIRVTITRPDEKENYQPCDLFLNDIARLVPWLIDKDCVEVDILDRTCDRQDEFRKHRLYYIISEPTWQLFQRADERVILTNDQSLGQPLQKRERDEKPSYLVFDQFSLAKCLAEHCQEIGGCFEYTCVEELKDEECLRETEIVKEINEFQQDLGMENFLEKMEKVQKKNEISEKSSKEIEMVENLEKTFEDMGKKSNGESSLEVLREEIKDSEIKKTVAENKKVLLLEPKEKVPNAEMDKEFESVDQEMNEKQCETEKEVTTATATIKENPKCKPIKKQSGVIKRKQRSLTQPRPDKTQSKSTSELETSQKSDKPVCRKERKKRKSLILSNEEPLSKLRRLTDFEDSHRRTRSGKVLEKDKARKPTSNKKGSQSSKGRQKKEKLERAEMKVEEPIRSLRSQVEVQGNVKGKKRWRKEAEEGMRSLSKTNGRKGKGKIFRVVELSKFQREVDRLKV